VVKLWKGLRLPYYWLWIPIASALLIWLVGISPVVVILVGALGGWFYTIVLKQSVKYIGDNDKEGK
jgi:chromate transporter